MTVYRTEFRRGSVTGSPLGLRARNQTPRTAQGRGHLWLDQSGTLKTTVGASGARRTGVVGSSALQSVSIRGVQPYHYWDFMTDKAWFAGVGINGVANTPGWSFTRASAGYAETVAGTLVPFASGELRRTDRGILLEGARTNLFLNSAVGVTQSVTVTAAAHALSFRGTGTITLSGVSTSGPLVGTGVNNTVSLTFTPTAGTLTLTVRGSVTNVNLEVGSAASSWIETAGASATRAADVLVVTTPGVVFPMSLWAEFEQRYAPLVGQTFFQLDTNTDDDSFRIGLNVSSIPNAVMSVGAVVQASPNTAAAISPLTVYRQAARFSTNSVQVRCDGRFGTEDTLATVSSSPTSLRFGVRAANITQYFGYIRRAAIFNTALNDTQLQDVTA